MDSSKEEYAEQPEVNQKEAVGALRPTIEPVSKRPFYPNMGSGSVNRNGNGGTETGTEEQGPPAEELPTGENRQNNECAGNNRRLKCRFEALMTNSFCRIVHIV